jgi:hypothetical protein
MHDERWSRFSLAVLMVWAISGWQWPRRDAI